MRSSRGNTELSDTRSPEDKEAISITRFPEYVRSLHANSDHLFSEDFDVRISLFPPSFSFPSYSLLMHSVFVSVQLPNACVLMLDFSSLKMFFSASFLLCELGVGWHGVGECV